MLRIDDHSRDAAGLRYVYPVVSRRAAGVSVGINLNPNNACNWRCIYCQVPGLKRGGPPPIDLSRLRSELGTLLSDLVTGDYLERHVPVGMRRLADLAFSGNGEPTSAAEFAEAVDIAIATMGDFDLLGRLPLRVITNGSLIDRRPVQQGLARLGETGGEVWFKLDTGTAAGLAAINGTRSTPETVGRRLHRCAGLAATWLQSCFFIGRDGLPVEHEVQAYLGLIRDAAPYLRGVHLYSLARPPQLADGKALRTVPAAWLEALGARIAGQTGLTVSVSP